MSPEKHGLELPLPTVDVSGPCPTNGEEETELCVRSHPEPADCDAWR